MSREDSDSVECEECGKSFPVYKCRYCDIVLCEDCMDEHIEYDHPDKFNRNYRGE